MAIRTFGLDVDELIDAALESPTGDRDADVLEALTWKDLESSSCSPAWKRFGRMVRSLEHGMIAHPLNPMRDEYSAVVRKRGGHLLRLDGVRTLHVVVEKTGWDFRRLPVDDGSSNDVDLMLRVVSDALVTTFGGYEYLVDDEVAPSRAALVVATTMAVVLQDESAWVRDDGARARVLRADIYEAAIRSMGLANVKLAPYLSAVRSLLELDHDQHRRLSLPGGGELDVGFVELRGRKTEYLAVHPGAMQRVISHLKELLRSPPL